MSCVMLCGEMIDFMLLGGFGDKQMDGQTDGQTDICTSRVTFATEKAVLTKY